MIRRFSLLCFLLILVVQFPITITAQGDIPNPPDPALYQWATFVDGVDSPIYVTHAGDGSGRVFVAEQAGPIFVVENGLLNPTPFLDLSDIVIDDVIKGGYTERGLLGLAFHPDYAKNGFFFVYYIDKSGTAILARYKVLASDPNQADPASAVTLLTISQPYDNHKAGQLAFGPDGYLYIGVGDGGNNGDPQGYAQNKQSLLGKLLRIDVNSEPYSIPPTNPFIKADNVAHEIWAFGLRNPWRFSFDRATGDLYIGEVGEHALEELDFQPASSPGGENYGWNIYEGNTKFLPDATDIESVKPIFTYEHTTGCSIVSGYVYRGKALPALQGVYFFSDYCVGRVWSAYRDASGTWKIEVFSDLGTPVSSFGEDEAGELYAVAYTGSVLRLQAK
jgi:glucose/arabinose dehydrogenase